MIRHPRVIPVLDVKAGRAVRAVGGERAHYGPLRSVLHPDNDDPLALARAVRDRLGLDALYLADLDAITGVAPPALDLFGDLAALGLAAWVDAGVREAVDVAPLLASGVGTVVLGLETLRGPEALRAVVAAFGPERLAASLDLRDGRPMVPTAESWGTDDSLALAGIFLDAGLRRLIVLDLARVGTGRGVGTLPLLAELRAASPSLDLIAGGGVSGPDDLRALEAAGASGVLVGSALHDGRIGLTAAPRRR